MAYREVEDRRDYVDKKIDGIAEKVGRLSSLEKTAPDGMK